MPSEPGGPIAPISVVGADLTPDLNVRPNARFRVLVQLQCVVWCRKQPLSALWSPITMGNPAWAVVVVSLLRPVLETKVEVVVEQRERPR